MSKAIEAVARDGLRWRLVHVDGSPVCVGDQITDFRGDVHVADGGQPPHKAGAVGYVDTQSGAHLYVTVFNLHWERMP